LPALRAAVELQVRFSRTGQGRACKEGNEKGRYGSLERIHGNGVSSRELVWMRFPPSRAGCGQAVVTGREPTHGRASSDFRMRPFGGAAAFVRQRGGRCQARCRQDHAVIKTLICGVRTGR
jgi:hypothetical protein